MASAELSDYDKLKRIPFLYGYSVLTATAVMCTVGAPLVLFAAELGVDKDRIGLIGGILPFFQVLGVAFLPLIMRFGARNVAASALIARYLFVLLFLLAPMFANSPDTVFALLFAAMAAYGLCRTLSEAAAVPWSQEFMPKLIRGQITGRLALAYLPVALIVSFLIQLWLDGHQGIERFFPVFVVGIVIGILGALSLYGLGGGRPRPDARKGLDSIRALSDPIRDGNFRAFLFSSGTQYLVFSALNIFLLLFFRERLGISSGQLVLMSALIPVGGAAGSMAAGWFVDRYGTRAIRVTLQSLQVLLMLALPFAHKDMPGLELAVGATFFAIGMLLQGSMAAGNIYMLNYVPPERRESYMALAYSSDGIFGGGLTFLAGVLLQQLEANGLVIGTAHFGGYEVFFVICALLIVASAVSFAMLTEDGATGVRDFLGQFYSGNPLRAFWGINRVGSLTSEERRRDLAYGFGGIGSTLAKEELIASLADPSFDVRHEAIRALGRLPHNATVVRALESMLDYDGLIELQYAALDSLGQIGARQSGPKLARFLDDPNPLLRARAMRSLGDIRDHNYLRDIRLLLVRDKEVDCRLAAASALGKFQDRESLGNLLLVYREQATDELSMAGEPRSKVVLLAISKVLGIEARFSRNWRREEKLSGYRLPELLARIATSLPRHAGEMVEQRRRNLLRAASELGTGSTSESFTALQALRPDIAAHNHADTALVLQLMDATADIMEPHRALMILLCVAIEKVLRAA
ncbi:MFS transporter [Devosia epidermidihirudinis]|nr:MFS transporter [Devosia epidermidihirudinis]